MKCKSLLIIFSIFIISGCTKLPPSINILGAYFPDWLFCITGGSITTAMIYVIASRFKKNELLSPYILTYPLLISFFSMGYWFIFFN
ncbi:YtcA family lipoprotein [Klebsiella aerogenes]|uniref:YtcA family lipoprotein n=1 Tax=Klebsiella aerogenes TaxID=548 RepID=UPI00092EB369